MIRKIVAFLLRLLSPGYGHCYKCGMPWNSVSHHDTMYNKTSGMFPLCEKCWSSLTIQERLPFYEKCYDTWLHQGDVQSWEEIEKAVLAGK